ncbi:MAG: hypothetical protein HY293_14720 [Planctomycetes bacterium]|nr:hypothetical protein [Planctomycetota bacterium]
MKRAVFLLFLASCSHSEDPDDSRLDELNLRSLAEKGSPWNGVSTRLQLVDEAPALGKPVRVRLDLVNGGQAAVIYDDQGVSTNESLDVVGPDGHRAPFIDISRQTAGSSRILEPGKSVTLFKELDLSENYLLDVPGKYHVRFSGRGLWIIDLQEIPFLVHGRRMDPGDEPLLTSDWIVFDVADGKTSGSTEVARRLLGIAPKGWRVAALTASDGTLHAELSRSTGLIDTVKRVSIHIGGDAASPKREYFGQSPWGKVTVATTRNEGADAWPDFRAPLRAALSIDPK